jgi:hypothetical protein
MLKRYWPTIPLAVFLALAIFFEWSSARAPSPVNQTASNQQANNRPVNDNSPTLFAIGTWASSNHDAIEALAAVLSVIFTAVLVGANIALWRVTRTAANAAKEAADAATDGAKIAEKAMLTLEIPYLYPFIRKHGFITSVSQYTKVLAVSDFDFGNDFIQVYFKNFGRTPAEITEVQCVLIPSMGMPRAPQWPDRYINPLSGHIVAANGGESQDFPYSFFKGTLEGASPTPIRLETTTFWFLGYVRYKDVFENEYIRGFCLGYSPMANNFYPCGGEGYNYRKKTKSTGETEAAK